MNIARLWSQWYREARRERVGRRELAALSDHLRRDIGVLHHDAPVTGADARRTTAASAPSTRSAVVLHLLQAGGPDTPRTTLGLRPERAARSVGARAA